LKAHLAAYPALDLLIGPREAMAALIEIVPDDPDLLDLVAALSPGNDDLAWAADWLRSRGDAALPALERLFLGHAVYSRTPRTLAALIAGRGTAAHPVLLRLLNATPPQHVPREILVTAMADAGTVPPEAIPLVAKWFAEGFDRGAGRYTAGFLAQAGEDGEAAVLGVVRDFPWHDRHWWEVAESAPPEFLARLSRRWLAKHGEGIPTTPFAVAEGGSRRTPAVGGPGGGAFERRAPDGAALAGLVVTLGADGWTPVVRKVEPLFGDLLGPGADTPGRVVLRAPRDHVVVGLLVKSGRLVDGLALVFARLRDGKPDPADLCLSRWAGGEGGSPMRLLGGDGTRVTGIHGRAGDLLDAVGLVGP
jgi:hypothetical protein